MSDELYRVTYSPKAYADIASIKKYIKYDLKNEVAAKSIINLIENKINSLDYSPKRFQEINMVYKNNSVRRMPIKKYNVFYSVDDINKSVTVLRIAYGGANINQLAILD